MCYPVHVRVTVVGEDDVGKDLEIKIIKHDTRSSFSFQKLSYILLQATTHVVHKIAITWSGLAYSKFIQPSERLKYQLKIQ